MFPRGFERFPFPTVALVGKEGAVNYPVAGQPDKEAVGALFGLVNAGDARVPSVFPVGHIQRSVCAAIMQGCAVRSTANLGDWGIGSVCSLLFEQTWETVIAPGYMALLKENGAATPSLSKRAAASRLAPHEVEVREILVRLSRMLGQPRLLGRSTGYWSRKSKV